MLLVVEVVDCQVVRKKGVRLRAVSGGVVDRLEVEEDLLLVVRHHDRVKQHRALEYLGILYANSVSAQMVSMARSIWRMGHLSNFVVSLWTLGGHQLRVLSLLELGPLDVTFADAEDTALQRWSVINLSEYARMFVT